jgi:hypothetical protein
VQAPRSMQLTSLLAAPKVCSQLDECHNDAGVIERFKRTVTQWSATVWRVYQSWAPDAQTVVAYIYFSGITRDEACAKADKWVQSMRNVDPEPSKKKARGQAKDYGGTPQRARSSRASKAAPVSYSKPKKAAGKAGPGRPSKSANSVDASDFSCRTVAGLAKELQGVKDGHVLAKEMSNVIWAMNVQLTHLSAELSLEKKEKLLLQGKLDGIRQAIVHCHGNLDELTTNEAKKLAGSGYSETELHRTIRRHVHHVLDAVKEKAGGDALKAAQLSQAVARRLSGIPMVQTDTLSFCKDLVFTALQDYFELLKSSHAGRYPNAARVAYQSVLSAIAGQLPPGSMHRVAAALGVPEEQLGAARVRWDEYCDCDHVRAEPFDYKGKAPHPYNSEWAEFVFETLVSDEVTRASEKASDKLHNPHTKSDPELRTVRYLEMSLKELLKLILEKGVEHFSQECPLDAKEFTISSWKLREVMRERAWEVKRGGRDVCLCRYHLGWELYTAGLYYARKRIRDSKLVDAATQKESKNIRSARELTRHLLCERPDGEDWRSRACIDRSCSTCGDMQKRLAISAAEMEVLKDQTVKYERWQKGAEDDDDEDKWDFRAVEKPFPEFIKEMHEYFDNVFIKHHEQSVWQDHDWSQQCRNFPRGSYCSVVDFAEKYSHQAKSEHQSAYFHEVRSTIYPIVVSMDVRDLKDEFFDIEGSGGAGHKITLLEEFEELGQRPVITISYIVISADPTQTHQVVQHIDDNIFTPWIKSIFIEPPHTHYRRSDGCAAQFKDKDMFYWISTHKIRTGICLSWSYFCTAHGKCWCDPEGGTVKNAARAHELKYHAGKDGHYRLPTTADLMTFCNSYLTWPVKHLFHADKKGRGIFKRLFHQVPTHGPGAVDYKKRLQCHGLEGTRAMHQIRDTGVECKVMVRNRSCHGCDSCWNGDWDHCSAIERVGKTDHVNLNPPTQIVQRVLRSHAALKEDGRALCIQAGANLVGKFIAVELAWADPGTDVEPYCIVRADTIVKQHPITEAPIKCTKEDDRTWMGTLRRRDAYFMATKLEPIHHGANIFVLTKKQFWVFPDDVRVVDLELTQHMGTTRSKIDKLAMSVASKHKILERLCTDEFEQRLN